jgi:uncharacterized protein with PQ loop repeat
VVVEMLAWCGAALSCLLCIPQAARTIRAERLDGVSASTYWIVLANAAVWAAWSLITGEHAAGAPALVNGPAAVLILRRLRAPSPPAVLPACGPGLAACDTGSDPAAAE